MSPFAFFEWIVAFRFMREGLTQTLLIVFGVALGGGVIIFMSALLGGMQANIVRRTLNYQAPISILPPDQVARPLRERESAEIAAQVQPRSQRLRSPPTIRARRRGRKAARFRPAPSPPFP